MGDLKNKKVLDCCCGYGFTSVKCAKQGAFVTGIDISPQMIKLSKKNATFNKISSKTNFHVMSVEKMEFDDNEFDFALGLGALHHLNLDFSGKEIARVLKPGGRALFVEPRIPFKWLIFLRAIFPNKCYESPGGAQLSDADIKRFAVYFTHHEIQYFIFLKKLTRFSFIKNYSSQLDNIDRILVDRFPFLKVFYWAFVLEFMK